MRVEYGLIIFNRIIRTPARMVRKTRFHIYIYIISSAVNENSIPRRSIYIYIYMNAMHGPRYVRTRIWRYWFWYDRSYVRRETGRESHREFIKSIYPVWSPQKPKAWRWHDDGMTTAWQVRHSAVVRTTCVLLIEIEIFTKNMCIGVVIASSSSSTYWFIPLK